MEVNIDLPMLVGKHFLSGVSYQTVVKEYRDSCQFSFILDGVTLTAIEDPNDGYRSNLRELKISNEQVETTFDPVPVIVTINDNEDILTFYAENGKEVLKLGTDHSDSYYPICIIEYTPENLPQNQGK